MSTNNSTREFLCAGCNHIFHTTTTPEEQEAEFKDIYGHSVAESDEEVVSVCDACYAIIVEKLNDSN